LFDDDDDDGGFFGKPAAKGIYDLCGSAFFSGFILT
jgi:hypothetical protein